MNRRIKTFAQLFENANDLTYEQIDFIEDHLKPHPSYKNHKPTWEFNEETGRVDIDGFFAADGQKNLRGIRFGSIKGSFRIDNYTGELPGDTGPVYVDLTFTLSGRGANKLDFGLKECFELDISLSGISSLDGCPQINNSLSIYGCENIKSLKGIRVNDDLISNGYGINISANKSGLVNLEHVPEVIGHISLRECKNLVSLEGIKTITDSLVCDQFEIKSPYLNQAGYIKTYSETNEDGKKLISTIIDYEENAEEVSDDLVKIITGGNSSKLVNALVSDFPDLWELVKPKLGRGADEVADLADLGF